MKRSNAKFEDALPNRLLLLLLLKISKVLLSLRHKFWRGEKKEQPGKKECYFHKHKTRVEVLTQT